MSRFTYIDFEKFSFTKQTLHKKKCKDVDFIKDLKKMSYISLI